MKRFKINKRFEALALVSALALTSLVGCGKKDEVTISRDEYDKYISIVNSEETATDTEATEEVTTEEKAEDTFIPGDLDIDSNASIENEVDAIYEANAEWYDKMAMDKDSIRDLIFVANDKYTDEEGNLIIDEDRAQEAYANIERIMGNAGVKKYCPILQKMDNINTIEYEKDSEIGLQVSEENNWNIIEYPSLTQYIDTDKAGGKATVEKLEEFEELRDYEIKTMNETGKYDRDRINEYVIKMEITDYNTNGGNKGGTNKNGQEYIIAATCDAALQFAAIANPQVIYLEGYNGIEENIKINATNEERFLENDIIDMTLNGTLDATTVDSAINEIISNSEKTENGLAYTGEEEVLLEKYALTNDQLRLIMSYAHYLTTMADHKYKEVECDEEAETLDDIKTKRRESSSLDKPKTLVLC